MTEKTFYLVWVCLGVGILSWCLRALPFILFGGKGGPPKTVTYIGRVLSPAAIAMLVVYCYAGYVNSAAAREGIFFLPEITAGIFTAALHVWRQNPLLSILTGTALYMFLIHVMG